LYKKGEDEIVLKAKGNSAWEFGMDQESKAHAIMSSEASTGLSALLGGQTVYMTVQKT
jgi:hypothetical protein